MSFVIDNSVVMAWCFEDECSEYADNVLDRLAVEEAFAPSIWPLEVVNVLLVAERRKRITKLDSARFVKLLDALPISVCNTPSSDIFSDILFLGRSMKLSAYDASYLHLALHMELPLATQDQDMLKAAPECRVPIV